MSKAKEGLVEEVVNVDTANSTTSDMGFVRVEGSRKKLIICFLGIFISYFLYGLLQEKITKGNYGEGDKFTYTLALVFVQCIINAVFAQTAIQLTKPGKDLAPQRLYATMTVTYLGAMLASNHSLQYVSYPTQVLGKSVKPIPVMILGVLLARKRYPLQKYLFVLMIVMGVALFMFKDKKGAVDDHTLGWGEILLLASLTMDGLTGASQDRMRGEYNTKTYHMMLYINVWSILFLGIALLLTGEGLEFLYFAAKYPEVLTNMVIFSCCSAVGQNFIFMTVTTFGPLTCSIITTTRKFFTILASVLIFQHPMIGRQWAGTVLVFIGLALDSAYGKERKTKPATK